MNIYYGSNSDVAAIILPGFNLSKSGPYFLLSNIAKECKNVGVTVFQFDYFGDGDSSGSYINTTVNYIQQSIYMVREYARKCGFNRFIYIGYGAGNVLSAWMSEANDTVGICAIAPDFTAHTHFSKVLNESIAISKDNIYMEHYIWPDTSKEILKRYWCSIVGIIDWLYHTPFNINMLQQFSEIKSMNKICEFTGKKLLISPQNIDETQYYFEEDEIVSISGLELKSKNEWEDDGKWPVIWDEIIYTIKEWMGNIENNKEEINNPINFSDLELLNEIDYSVEGIQRKSISFLSEEKIINGILHMPARGIGETKHPCVIYEPGLGGSRVDIGRAGPWLGNKLAENGYICLRYDSIGSGVSGGEFYEMTWEKRYKNLCSAIDYLKNIKTADISKIFLVSYSAGSKVAVLAGNRIENIVGCVMWSPHFIDKLENERKQRITLRHNKDLVFPMCGLWLGYYYVKEDKLYNFMEIFDIMEKNILIITGDKQECDENILPLLSSCHNDENKKILQYPGAHLFLYKYMKSIINDTVEFIDKKLGGTCHNEINFKGCQTK